MAAISAAMLAGFTRSTRAPGSLPAAGGKFCSAHSFKSSRARPGYSSGSACRAGTSAPAVPGVRGRIPLAIRAEPRAGHGQFLTQTAQLGVFGSFKTANLLFECSNTGHLTDIRRHAPKQRRYRATSKTHAPPDCGGRPPASSPPAWDAAPLIHANTRSLTLA